MTNFELAQTLVRLGAVRAMALDGGGSTTMAFDGRLLNRPSGLPRPVSNALVFLYTGVFVPPPAPVVSPNGDGDADEQLLRVKLVRPSTVTVALLAPDGSTAYSAVEARDVGSFAVPFPPPPTSPPTRLLPLVRTGPTAAPEPGELPDGRWRLTVEATDELGQSSAMSRAFMLNTTLGFLATAKPRALPAARRAAARYLVAAGARGTRCRHGRDGGRRGRANPGATALRAGPDQPRLERA